VKNLLTILIPLFIFDRINCLGFPIRFCICCGYCFKIADEEREDEIIVYRVVIDSHKNMNSKRVNASVFCFYFSGFFFSVRFMAFFMTGFFSI
jgi:hypothetical protein